MGIETASMLHLRWKHFRELEFPDKEKVVIVMLTTSTHIKGSSIPLEHIDLLRPVPTGKEKESSPVGDEEEE